MLSVKAIFDGKTLQLLEPVDIETPQEVIVTFLQTNELESHSLTISKEENRRKILALAGAWEDMPEEDFQAYLKEANQTGNDLFGREVDL